MKKLNIVIILVLIGIIAYLWFFKKPEVITHTETVYKTDTLYIDKPYPIPVPYPVEVPPHVVTLYEKDTIAINNLKLLLSEKDIIIQGLNSQILISQDFIKQYPSNPKLLELNLSPDSLSLSLLGLDGIPLSKRYPLFLSRHKYKWTIEGLTKSNISSPPIKTPVRYFVGGGANFLYPSPYVDFMVEKEWTRMRLYGDIKVGLLKREASSIDIGLRYNIKTHGFN